MYGHILQTLTFTTKTQLVRICELWVVDGNNIGKHLSDLASGNTENSLQYYIERFPSFWVPVTTDSEPWAKYSL